MGGSSGLLGFEILDWFVNARVDDRCESFSISGFQFLGQSRKNRGFPVETRVT